MQISARKNTIINPATLLCASALAIGLSACSTPGSTTTPTTPQAAARPQAGGTSAAATSTTPAASASAGAATAVTPITWFEQFSARDAASFVSTAYATNPSDNGKALYAPAAGSMKLADGALTLANARFTVGALGDAATGATTPGGVFALTGKSCTLTLNIRNASGTGNFYVYVDNNTTSQGNSPHGNASRVVSVATASLKEGQNALKWSLKSSYTGLSFLQIRADSASTVVIDSANMNCA